MRISISKVRLFKSCRRAYWLKYVQGLEPTQRAEPLETGLAYHERVASLYAGGDVLEDYSKTHAMVEAYRKYIYPRIPKVEAEQWFEVPFGADVLVGRIDGMTPDGILLEHKTTSSPIGEDYEYGLQWDEQILAYMYMTGKREMYYTVCRKPTIRQKQSETEEDFYHRMEAWYAEDTDSKIRLLHIVRTDREVEEFAQSLKAVVWQMKAFESEESYYRNSSYCLMWGRRCEYSSICLGYDPEADYIEFAKNERGKGNENSNLSY